MIIVFSIGMACIILCYFAIIWSILVPSKRVWPLKHLTSVKFIVIWSGTFLAFGTCIVLGVLDWNALNFPTVLRFGWVHLLF